MNAETIATAILVKPIAGLGVYGLWSRGYKSGGFFGMPATALAAITGFDPETVDNREIGLRARFAGGRAAAGRTWPTLAT
ncbi:MAG TPA: hypothetical protein VMG08_14485 [Allosphingosinicella sp.]|nr:hypothetical protein [Allosphingosinicella sp.]